ncbi:MAG: hypothetical protein H7257_11750 [Taibaiella sp.]|nr:hypothetical protein [Taibaiella sp.]
MDFNKVRYYLGGIIFIVIALLCTLSILQDVAGYKILVFDWIAIAISLPMAVFMLKKGRERTKYDENKTD